MSLETEILNFIKTQPRTRNEIRIKFNLSNTQSFNTLKFMERVNDIECIEVTSSTSRVGRTFIYRTVRNKNG